MSTINNIKLYLYKNSYIHKSSTRNILYNFPNINTFFLTLFQFYLQILSFFTDTLNYFINKNKIYLLTNKLFLAINIKIYYFKYIKNIYITYTNINKFNPKIDI